MKTKAAALQSVLHLIADLPSVRCSVFTLNAADVANIRDNVRKQMSEAGFSYQQIETVCEAFRAGLHYCIVRPDSPSVCAELNAAATEAGISVLPFRVQTGFEDGAAKSVDYYASVFSFFGFSDLCNGLSAATLKDAKKAFTSVTLPLRDSCYQICGRAAYRVKQSGTLAACLVKMHETKDGRSFPADPKQRTLGNVYAIFGENVAEAVARENQRAAAELTERLAKQHAKQQQTEAVATEPEPKPEPKQQRPKRSRKAGSR